MNITKKAVIGISGTLLGLSLVAGQAQAMPISQGSSISFGMSAIAVDVANNPLTSFTNAVGIDFENIANNAFVQGASGDYAASGFGIGDVASFNDFTFAPALVPSPVTLWTANSGLPANNIASFSLESLIINGQDANTLDLSGTGTLSLTGFDDTEGVWTLSGDISTGSTVFGFSSTNTAIPEPSILALLGLGLLGFAGSRRLNKKV